MGQDEDSPTITNGSSQVPIPKPRYRHATPSGPWPFLDLLDPVPKERIERRPEEGKCKHDDEVVNCNKCLNGYPQSLFPNWTQFQQEKSGIHGVKLLNHHCSFLCVEMPIKPSGKTFSLLPTIHVDRDDHENAAVELREFRTRRTKVQAIFVDGISGPALKMLGTIYDIEPFYFSSSIGWTPSRFQESLDPGKSDHITLTLRFIRRIPKHVKGDHPSPKKKRISQRSAIDVHKPLVLDDSMLQPDLLAFHMIRSKDDSTIISYHCSEKYGSTSAEELCTRLQLVGRSVYWSKIFHNYSDPTFVLVSMLWYALYAWDEAIQGLYAKICQLEVEVIKTLNTLVLAKLMDDLHTIRAHMLYYISLLGDFQKAVTFVRNTPNPAAESTQKARDMMYGECDHILREISRLEKDCQTQDLRLKNVVHLGYSRLNIYDSRQTTKLTQASLRDSAAMKQISYLTMVFLPAAFTSSVFGINVAELNPGCAPALWAYVATAVPLTILTIWLVGAMQLPSMAYDINPYADGKQAVEEREYKWSRLWWPVVLIRTSLTNQPENRRIRGLLE